MPEKGSNGKSGPRSTKDADKPGRPSAAEGQKHLDQKQAVREEKRTRESEKRHLPRGSGSVEQHRQTQRRRLCANLCDGSRRATLLKIQDNGCGLIVSDNLDTQQSLQGYGLLSMKERVEICKGTFQVKSAPG